MFRFIAIIAFLFLPLIACAQSRMAPGEAGTAPIATEQDMTPDCMRPLLLIGKPQSAVSTIQFTNPMRVLLPGDAATMDYSPSRTNIILDAQGIIRDITCG